MNKEKIEQVIIRFSKLFIKDKNYYAFDYALPHKIDEKGKKRYEKPPWFVPQEINLGKYEHHLGLMYPKHDWGLILPPINEKGEASYGGIDVDVYDQPELIERVVKQIYDEKLPLAPCYSNSHGLHLYFFTKGLMSATNIVSTLKNYNKHLGTKAKEIFPKQTKLKWLEKKKRFEYGNGILLPYRSCINSDGEQLLTNKESYLKPESKKEQTPENPWIKNSDLETGTIEEFLDYAEGIQED